MRCVQCERPAIIGQPARCKQHFIEGFEARVKETIARFGMVPEGARVAVACSGGKDSLTLLHLMRKWHDDVTAIVIDEGIAGYREKTLKDLERVAKGLGVPIIKESYEEYAGARLDDILARHGGHPCTVCGVFRRHLIARASKGFDVLATGHNLDDEAQTVLMNLLKGNTDVFPRGGPVTGVGAKGFTQRVKPLSFCTEKEVATYAWLHGFVSAFTECPNARQGYRWKVREALNRLEAKHPGVKRRILDRFLEEKARFPPQPDALPACRECGAPTNRDVCKACELLAKVRA